VVAAGELLSDVQVMEGGPDTIRGQFDCVVANMRAAEILDCLAVILELWNRSGPLVLSGLRESEVSDLIAAVDCPVELRIVCEDFTGLAFRAQTSGEAR
jgi:ribosomal protein L11 methylase PrmA